MTGYVSIEALRTQLDSLIAREKASEPRWGLSRSADPQVQHTRGVIEGLMLAKITAVELENQ